MALTHGVEHAWVWCVWCLMDMRLKSYNMDRSSVCHYVQPLLSPWCSLAYANQQWKLWFKSQCCALLPLRIQSNTESSWSFEAGRSSRILELWNGNDCIKHKKSAFLLKMAQNMQRWQIFQTLHETNVLYLPLKWGEVQVLSAIQWISLICV